MTHYVLKGKEVIPCDDVIEWAEWLEKANRHVAHDKKDDIAVSTVFLGINHSFGEGPPLLFQTMVFGGPHDQDQNRYSTWEKAEVGHKEMCRKAGIS